MVLKKNWNHYAYIEDITVDKKYRTLGVGKRLVDQAKQWAKKAICQVSCLKHKIIMSQDVSSMKNADL